MKKKTSEFQLTIKNKQGRKTPVTVQIDLDGDQVVGIRGLNARGTDAYDISFKVRKRNTTKVANLSGGGDECFECQKPNTPCPPNDLVEVPCS